MCGWTDVCIFQVWGRRGFLGHFRGFLKSRCRGENFAILGAKNRDFKMGNGPKKGLRMAKRGEGTLDPPLFSGELGGGSNRCLYPDLMGGSTET